MPMQNSNRSLGLGLLALVLIVIIYFIWPYLVAFLTIVGAAQVYRVCRNHFGSRP